MNSRYNQVLQQIAALIKEINQVLEERGSENRLLAYPGHFETVDIWWRNTDPDDVKEEKSMNPLHGAEDALHWLHAFYRGLTFK